MMKENRANVVEMPIQGEQTAVTDEAGNYRFIQLPTGTYNLKFELPGFTTFIREEIIVSLADGAPFPSAYSMRGEDAFSLVIQCIRRFRRHSESV